MGCGCGGVVPHTFALFCLLWAWISRRSGIVMFHHDACGKTSNKTLSAFLIMVDFIDLVQKGSHPSYFNS